MRVHFWKIHGIGNDFICIDSTSLPAVNWAEVATRLCNRHFGIGSDGLMLAYYDETRGISRVQMFNPDGSRSAMCGNGVRCVVRFLFMQELLQSTQTRVHLDFDGRDLECLTNDQGRNVEVDMGVVTFEPEKVPVHSEIPVMRRPFSMKNGFQTAAESADFMLSVAQVGNPHALVVVKEVDKIDLEVMGSALENHAVFPEKTNVEFVEIISPSKLRVRVWERNAGATLACGSGASAVVATLAAQGLCSDEATVELPGGPLQIIWDKTTKRVRMIGSAEEVFEGWIDI